MLSNSLVFGFPLITIVILCLGVMSCKMFFSPVLRLPYLLPIFILSTIYFLIVIYLYPVSYSYLYPLWPIFCMLLLICYLMIKNIPLKVHCFTFIIFLFYFIVLYFGHKIDGRLHFFFGPNTLYRLVSLFFLFFYFYNKPLKNNILYFSIIWFLYTLLILEIGSRGGLIIYLFVHVVIILNLRLYKLFFVVFTFFLTISMFAFSFSELSDFSRILNFQNILLNPRFLNLQDFLSLTDFLLGDGYSVFSKFSSSGYMYPHNILIELASYFGILGLFIVLLLLFSFVYCSHKLISYDFSIKSYYHMFILAFPIFFISSLLSGDLFDNYPIISLSLIFLSNTSCIGCKKILS